ncbi:MAG: ABC transporter ATP-binding protein [Saprospiraceae bacterium]|nr:ABC transporter ATP-binding protein [Candidatus Brachybacter algidus]
MENQLLKVKDLRIAFNTEGRINEVIKGIDLNINRGEIIGLVGESGSGKSVTGLSLLGLLPADNAKITGSIEYNHEGKTKQLIGLEDNLFRKIKGKSISMIFQEPMSSLNPVFTCGYQVDEMTRLHLKYSKQQAKDATLDFFKKVGLPEPLRIYNSYPHQISGGQIQRVMIAMAISCHPDLLIADEPTTALDVTIQKKILDLLVNIRDEFGISILFISHDLGVIRSITSRVNVMYKGSILEEGLTEEVLKHPKHLYTHGLIACKPPLYQKLERLPVVSDFVNISDRDGSLAFTQNEDKKSLERKHLVTPDRDAEPILRVENLTVKYPLKKNFWGKTTNYLNAVDDLSFSIQKGESLGVVGESGCGKSTLGRTLVHLEQAASGKAFLYGKELFSQSESAWKQTAKKIQIIFQDPYSSLNPKMKVGEAIMEPIIVHNLFKTKQERTSRLHSLLDQVGLLKEHAGRYPHEFSGGQRQRISIARALALEQELLICDESVAALDVSVQSQVLNLLKDLKEELSLSLLFITHDMSVVNFIADRIFVMNHGKIMESGVTQDVINSPQNDYTKRLVEAIPNWA